MTSISKKIRALPLENDDDDLLIIESFRKMISPIFCREHGRNEAAAMGEAPDIFKTSDGRHPYIGGLVSCPVSPCLVALETEARQVGGQWKVTCNHCNALMCWDGMVSLLHKTSQVCSHVLLTADPYPIIPHIVIYGIALYQKHAITHRLHKYFYVFVRYRFCELPYLTNSFLTFRNMSFPWLLMTVRTLLTTSSLS